jgi:hypothetical protein
MTSKERHLCSLFKQLPAAEQQTLLAFAEFLQTRQTTLPSPVQPQILPRPPEESVIAAVKRLSKTYPMLDKAKMLDETSSLMTAHLLHGRDKVDVINDLEALFLKHYNALGSE